MVKLAITCTQSRCDFIVSDLRADGINAYAAPALSVHALPHAMPDNNHYDGMLITSRHALDTDLPPLPVIAIGKQTASLAMEKGYTVIQTGNGDIKTLDITAYHSLLYPCADEPTCIPDNATAWPVYQTRRHPNFYIENQTAIIALFSAKAARITMQTDRAPSTFYVCMSQTVAQNLQGIPADRLAVCAQPDYDSMKEKIIEVWKQCHTQTD